MSITIKDVARRANVSIATVSRVINNKSDGVSDETRKEVLKVASDLGYYPNRVARGLVTNKTNILGLILPDITNPFFPSIVRGVEDTANKYGYNIILCNTDNSSEKEKTYIKILKENKVDGIICTSVAGSNDDSFKLSPNDKIPFVWLDRNLRETKAPMVYTDGVYGMCQIVDYIIKQGHKKIAYISGPKLNFSAEQRFKGYLKAINEAEIDVNNDLIKEGNYQIQDGNKCMMDIIESGEEFTAVVCANDLMAIGAIEALKSRGIRIPYDVSVTGYDDITISSITYPKLTTVAQPIYEMGCLAVDLLIKLIGGETIEKKEVVLKPELVIRESVGRVKRNWEI
jgi:LacI family transcriptional regulator